MDKQHDIKRLGKAVFHMENIFVLISHMDEAEYKRFREYINNRHKVSFPYDYPITKE